MLSEVPSIILILLLMSLKIIYWNFRGAGSQRCSSILNDLIRLHSLDMLILAEPKVSGSKAEEAIGRINMPSLERIDAEGKSGGLWVLSRNNNFKVEVLKVGYSFIHLSIKREECLEMICTAVYIYPQTTRKKLCVDNIKDLARGVTTPWCIIGDFNEILNEEEKRGGAPIDQNRCYRFKRWLNDCGLINLEAIGPRFTWRGQDYKGYGRIYERLDRVVCNAKWRNKFHEASVLNLPRIKSDHHPILLATSTTDRINKPRYPFRFEDT